MEGGREKGRFNAAEIDFASNEKWTKMAWRDPPLSLFESGFKYIFHKKRKVFI